MTSCINQKCTLIKNVFNNVKKYDAGCINCINLKCTLINNAFNKKIYNTMY